jgi:hypothetical protein
VVTAGNCLRCEDAAEKYFNYYGKQGLADGHTHAEGIAPTRSEDAAQNLPGASIKLAATRISVISLTQ